MPFFVYGQPEINYLKSRDKKLSMVIDEVGIITRDINPNPFSALIASVVSQQISNKAAETVWNKFNNLVGDLSPENIFHLELSTIQSCGMSFRKAGYIKNIAEAAVTGKIDFNNLHSLPDADIVNLLSSIRGVGEWTAEMLLIFSLGRPDVVSYKDLGIRKGMINLYGLKGLSKEQFERYRKRYSPYGSIASFYLWEIASR